MTRAGAPDDLAALPADEACDWIYELVIEEMASAWTPRGDVRGKLDRALTDAGDKLAALTITGKPARTEEAEAQRRRDDPANEQGAQQLMALAAGRR